MLGDRKRFIAEPNRNSSFPSRSGFGEARRAILGQVATAACRSACRRRRFAFASAADNLLGSGNATLNLTLGSGFDYATTYTIFENSTTAGFALAGITGFNDTAYTANFAQSGSNYDLSFTAVPEPSTYALLLAGVAAFIFARRRKSA